MTVYVYDRMADALALLGDTWRDWPDLNLCCGDEIIADSFEFTRWAGVSPRQYQAALAHVEARLLRGYS